MEEQKYFITGEFKEMLNQLHKNFTDSLVWGIPPDTRTEEEKYEDDCKFAYVFIKEEDKYPKMVFVNNKDMKAYEREEYETIRLDKPIEYFKFERWCRLMDM